jgi:glycosyltransferase involved in cell wall biosynthesis
VKICLVSQEFPPDTAHGGIGTQTWNKSRMLTKLGHDVHVLSCAAGSGGPELVTKLVDGVHVYRMQPPGHQFEVNSPAAYAVGYSWNVLRHLRDLSRTHAFDLINFPEYGAEGFAYQLDRTIWNWVPVIVQAHGPLAMFAERIGWPEPGGDHHRVLSFMEGESIRHADGLMASSANIADFTAGYYGVPRESIHVVHCGIDCEIFSPGDAAALDDQRPTVLFVGNIAASKGATLVFDAVMRLRPKHPGIRLQLLGKGDEEIVSSIKRRAREAGAEGSVEFLGFRDSRAELPAVYRGAHVFASPAQHETGVANVYVEAMSCGCPVIASTSGGAAEAVSDGQAGILVNPRDLDSTTTAIDRIISDRELRLRMGAAGRRRALEYFAVEKYIARVLAAYERAIERSKEKRAQLQMM